MHRRNSNCYIHKTQKITKSKYTQVSSSRNVSRMNRKFVLEKEAFCAKSNVLFLSSIRLSFCFISDHVFFWPLASACPCFSLQLDLSLSLFLSTYVPQGRCCQCDRIGLFSKGLLMTIFLTQMAQLFGDFWAIYKFISIYVSKTAIDTFLAIFWEILGVFLLHQLVTLSLPHSVFPCVCLCDSKTYFYLRPP